MTQGREAYCLATQIVPHHLVSHANMSVMERMTAPGEMVSVQTFQTQVTNKQKLPALKF